MPTIRLARLAFTFILAATLVLVPTVSASAAEATGFDVSTAETTMLSLLNAERTARGLVPLQMDPRLRSIARQRSADMVARDYFSHTIPGPGCADVYCLIDAAGVNWTRAGENIAWNSGFSDAESAQRAFAALMNSPGHRANMLNPDFTYIGIGAFGADDVSWNGYQSNPRMYTQVFIRGAGSTLLFADIGASPFIDDITWLAGEGITNGCGGGLFCPGSVVTRDQMASFLARALDLPSAGRDYFGDDAGNQHQDNINRLAASGITLGCGDGRFCPGAAVTRDQMASFLVRALRLPASGADPFVDDAGNQHEANINALAASGITRGCGPSSFCPAAAVTREQMAAFLHRGLGQ